MSKKKRSSGIRFTCPSLQTHRRAADATFTPITLESLGIVEQPQLQLEPGQELLLNAYLDVEKETLSVAFLEEMTQVRNPAKHKELLKLHRKRLKDAQERVLTLC